MCYRRLMGIVYTEKCKCSTDGCIMLERKNSILCHSFDDLPRNTFVIYHKNLHGLNCSYSSKYLQSPDLKQSMVWMISYCWSSTSSYSFRIIICIEKMKRKITDIRKILSHLFIRPNWCFIINMLKPKTHSIISPISSLPPQRSYQQDPKHCT